MKVRCIGNNLSALQNEEIVKRLQRSINLDGPNYDLVIGNDYNVQAIENRDNGWWYYIHSVEVNIYPNPYPCEFFQVADSALEMGWAVAMGAINGNETIKRVSFIEWASDDNFYEKLIEGDSKCLELYIKQLKKS